MSGTKIRPYLKPCPFCGCPDASVSVGRQGEHRVFCYAECEACAATGGPSASVPEGQGDDRQRIEAAEKWNARRTG